MTIDPRLYRIVAAQPYRLLFATISGAHLYGFPSPDSDFDLRGAHVLPLEKVVGLEVRDETVEQEMIVPPHPGPLPIGCGEGGALEMDIVSHDVRKRVNCSPFQRISEFLFVIPCRFAVAGFADGERGGDDFLARVDLASVDQRPEAAA